MTHETFTDRIARLYKGRVSARQIELLELIYSIDEDFKPESDEDRADCAGLAELGILFAHSDGTFSL